MKRSMICLLCVVLSGLSATEAFTAPEPIRIFAFGDFITREVDRLNTINGLVASGTENPNDITAELLSEYDVFFAGTSFYHDLDVHAQIIQEFLAAGGGVVIGQGNVVGPINWLPVGLEASIYSTSYPRNGTNVTTTAGMSHPIFNGLTILDFETGPTDKISTESLGSQWEVLMVHSTDQNMLGMAAGTYGEGRILLWPKNLKPDSTKAPSSQMMLNAFQWVAPEPTTLLMLALGGLLIRKR